MAFFHFLTTSFLYTQQDVSVCTAWLPFAVPTGPSLRTRQEVSSPHLLPFFCLPDQSLALNSTGCEYTSLADFLSLSQLVPCFVLDRR
jgi:hypothetical protein